MYRVFTIPGYLLLASGVFVLAVGLGMSVDPNPSDASTGVSISIFSTIMLFLAAGLIYQGRMSKKKEERRDAAVSIVKSYRRISLFDLSKKLNVSVKEATDLLSQALHNGELAGNFDRTTDEFYIEGSEGVTVQIKYCYNCGASLDQVYLKGDTVKCSHCGALLS